MKRTFAFLRCCGLAGLASAAFVAGSAGSAWAVQWADDCADMCGASGACTIGSTWDIVSGSTIDCSGRDLTIGASGTLRVTDGSFNLLADDLTLSGSSSTLTAVEGSGATPGEVSVKLTGNFTLEGKIRVDGDDGGGQISVIVAGNMSIPDSGTDGLEANGTTLTASGGSISVDVGGTLSIYDPILADGGGSGDNAGGQIEIRAGGNIVTNTNGHISASGHNDGGGTISITSETGDVTLYEFVKAEGLGDLGDGGNVEIFAGDYLDVRNEISTMGGVNVNGGHANGGSIQLESGCGGMNFVANLNAKGGQTGASYENGSISAETRGDLYLAAGVVFDSHALQSGGIGGPILLTARDLITLNSTTSLDARGSSTSPGRGGTVTLQSCRVNVGNGATIDTTGYYGGAVQLHASLDPPDTGTQPLLIGNTAVIHAAGNSSSTNGIIALAPLTGQVGQCSNSSTTPCLLDTDCNGISCTTGDCIYANPDTGGVASQFDMSPSRAADPSVARCESSCDASFQ